MMNEFPTIEGETIESYSYTISDEEVISGEFGTTVTADVEVIKQDTLSNSFSSVKEVREENKSKPAEEESINSYNLSGDEKNPAESKTAHSETTTETIDEKGNMVKKAEKKFKVKKIPESVQT